MVEKEKRKAGRNDVPANEENALERTGEPFKEIGNKGGKKDRELQKELEKKGYKDLGDIGVNE